MQGEEGTKVMRLIPVSSWQLLSLVSVVNYFLPKKLKNLQHFFTCEMENVFQVTNEGK